MLIISVIIGIYSYFGLCTFFQYINKSEIAIKMYPIYTEANINVMNKYVELDIQVANEIANKVYSTNKNVKEAYNVKSLYYMEKNLWDLMVSNKQKSLEIAKYDIENYEEYILMLSGAINYYAIIGDSEELNKYANLIIEVPSKIEKVQNNTTKLAYKLKKKPEMELKEEFNKYIKEINKLY